MKIEGLNGVYRASKDDSHYLIKFENGISKQGLKNFNKYFQENRIQFFKVSNFIESSNYNYTIALEDESEWLEYCICHETYMPKISVPKRNKIPLYEIY